MKTKTEISKIKQAAQARYYKLRKEGVPHSVAFGLIIEEILGGVAEVDASATPEEIGYSHPTN